MVSSFSGRVHVDLGLIPTAVPGVFDASCRVACRALAMVSPLEHRERRRTGLARRDEGEPAARKNQASGGPHPRTAPDSPPDSNGPDTDPGGSVGKHPGEGSKQ